MKKITLINPPLSLEQRYGELGKVLGELQPVNLCYLAAVAREAGYEPSIIDAPPLQLSIQEITDQIKEIKPDFVGISTTTNSVANAFLVANEIKKLFDIPIIVGGPHVNALPTETLDKFRDFDIGVTGEGEITFIELLNELCKEKPDLSYIKGIVYKDENGEFQVNESRPLIQDLDTLPLPAWDLLPDFKYYCPNLSTLSQLPAISLVTTRGCEKRCTYCDTMISGKVTRSHSPEYVMRMIDDLVYNYGVKAVLFKGPDFLVERDRLLKICELIQQRPYKLTFTCIGRADHVDVEVAQALQAAGFWQVGLGVETGSPTILKILNKQMEVSTVENAVSILDDHKINVMGFFIFGSPKETTKTMQETIDFMLRNRFTYIKVNFFMPYPGSVIYKHIRRWGTFDERWEDMNGAWPLFIPDDLDSDTLQSYGKMALRKFYFRPTTVWRFLKCVTSIDILKRYIKGMMVLITHIRNKNVQT